MFTTELQGQLKLFVVCHENYRQRQAGECADTWIQPTESVEL